MALNKGQQRDRMKSAISTIGAWILGAIILFGVVCGLPYSY